MLPDDDDDNGIYMETDNYKFVYYQVIVTIDKHNTATDDDDDDQGCICQIFTGGSEFRPTVTHRVTTACKQDA